MFKVVQAIYFITPVIGGIWIMGQVTEGGAWHQGAAGRISSTPILQLLLCGVAKLFIVHAVEVIAQERGGKQSEIAHSSYPLECA